MLYAYYRIHSMVQNMINLVKEHNIKFFKKKASCNDKYNSQSVSQAVISDVKAVLYIHVYQFTLLLTH